MRIKKHDQRKVILTYVAIWFALALVSTFIGVIATDAWTDYRLKTRGIEIQGRVIAKEPENHQFIRYVYVVGGQTFSAVGNAGRGNPPFTDLVIGDSLIVFYDPDNPGTSCLGYPSSHLQSSMGGIVFLVLLLPLFCIVTLYRKGYLRSKIHKGS